MTMFGVRLEDTPPQVFRRKKKNDLNSNIGSKTLPFIFWEKKESVDKNIVVLV